jgi:hypothetical protein
MCNTKRRLGIEDLFDEVLKITKRRARIIHVSFALVPDYNTPDPSKCGIFMHQIVMFPMRSP